MGRLLEGSSDRINSSENPLSPALDDEQLAAWRAFRFSSQLLMGALDRQLQRDAGIPNSWFGLLVALSEQPERTMRQADLAQALHFSLPRLSHAVDRMIERGWLHRSADPDDGRASRLTLTGNGIDALHDVSCGHADTVKELFVSPLTSRQLNQLGAACTALIAAMPAEDLPPALASRTGSGNSGRAGPPADELRTGPADG